MNLPLKNIFFSLSIKIRSSSLAIFFPPP